MTPGVDEGVSPISGENDRSAGADVLPRFRVPFNHVFAPGQRNNLVLLALIASTVFYVLLRIQELDRVVTVDEPVFLAISANFANAVAHGDLAKTSQFLYPAVTIMWAGTVGYMVEAPNYVKDYPHQIDDLYAVHGPIRAVGHEPLSVLIAARVAKIVFQACCFCIAFWLMYRLFGLTIATLAAAFIVFDPFLVAHDQLLHVDGVTGITAFVSVLAAVYADRVQTRKSLWILAGVMAALCWLTRLTGLVLLPIFLIVIADGAIDRYRRKTLTGKAALISAAGAAGVVVGASVVTTIVIWPALWVDPLGAIRFTIEEWRRSIETPHPWGLFFAGETVTGDPGLLFYVFVFLYKITPFTLFGLILMAFASLFRIAAIVPERSWRPVAILTSFVAVYSVGMAAGERKFDRYILPDFLFFDLLAAIGIVGVGRLIWATRRPAWRAAGVIAAAGLVAGQILTALTQRPYLLDYYNPLLGGTKTAARMVMVGWGEGLDQAAGYILSQPGGETSVVRISMTRTTMLYFLPETVTLRGLGSMGANPESILEWANTDYAVTHILQWKRSTSGPAVHYFDDLTPVYIVTIDGVPFVKVYDLHRIPPPRWMVEQSGCSWEFDGKITLAAYGQHRPVAGETDVPGAQQIDLVFQTNTPDQSAAYRLLGVLIPRLATDGPISFTTPVVPNPQRGLLTKVIQPVQLPEGKKLSDYWLQVSLTDSETNQSLPAVNLKTSIMSDHAGQPAC